MVFDALAPYTLRGVTFRNRIGMSPMCTYSAQEGHATQWHQLHLGARAQGGLGLVMVEATAISPEGRISPGDLGLWDDSQIISFEPVVRVIESQGAVPGIQIAHAGRKAGCARPWDGGKPLGSGSESTWRRVGPSPIAFSSDFPNPSALSPEEIRNLVVEFGQTARRARRGGFRVLEIHSAHGYLLHSFLSPLSNHRTDRYGGSLQGRMTLLREVVMECRRQWGEEFPMGVRLSMSDWYPGGLTDNDTLEVAHELKKLGVDFVDCSSGGNVPDPQLTSGPLYQVPFATRVKREAGLCSMAVGLVTQLEDVCSIISDQRADFVLLGRALLRDPFWLLNALYKAGGDGCPEWADQHPKFFSQIPSILHSLVPLQYRRGFELGYGKEKSLKVKR